MRRKRCCGFWRRLLGGASSVGAFAHAEAEHEGTAHNREERTESGREPRERNDDKHNAEQYEEAGARHAASIQAVPYDKQPRD